jgi:hypothetical protein
MQLFEDKTVIDFSIVLTSIDQTLHRSLGSIFGISSDDR